MTKDVLLLKNLIRLNAECMYLAFYKPYGVLSQFTQPEGSEKKTLSEFAFPPHVYPLGRLDYDSEGLLLLTDDSRLNQLLLDPVYGHARTYWVQVESLPSAQQLTLLSTGVTVQGRKTRPACVRLLNCEPTLPSRPVPIRQRKNIPTSWLELVLTEGRNHQVRRMTAAVGCPTLRLVRIAIGRLTLIGRDSLGLATSQFPAGSHAAQHACLSSQVSSVLQAADKLVCLDLVPGAWVKLSHQQLLTCFV